MVRRPGVQFIIARAHREETVGIRRSKARRVNSLAFDEENGGRKEQNWCRTYGEGLPVGTAMCSTPIPDTDGIGGLGGNHMRRNSAVLSMVFGIKAPAREPTTYPLTYSLAGSRQNGC